MSEKEPGIPDERPEEDEFIGHPNPSEEELLHWVTENIYLRIQNLTRAFPQLPEAPLREYLSTYDAGLLSERRDLYHLMRLFDDALFYWGTYDDESMDLYFKLEGPGQKFSWADRQKYGELIFKENVADLRAHAVAYKYGVDQASEEWVRSSINKELAMHFLSSDKSIPAELVEVAQHLRSSGELEQRELRWESSYEMRKTDMILRLQREGVSYQRASLRADEDMAQAKEQREMLSTVERTHLAWLMRKYSVRELVDLVFDLKGGKMPI